MKRILFLVFLFAASVLQAAEFEVVDQLTVNGATMLKSSVVVIVPNLNLPLSLWVSTSATTPHLYVSTNGNVGIGTTAPVEKLHINTGTDQNFGVRAASMFSTGGYILAHNDANTALQPMQYGASIHYFMGGNVGIGTTTPVCKLHAYDSGGNAKIRVEGNDSNTLDFRVDNSGQSWPFMGVDRAGASQIFSSNSPLVIGTFSSENLTLGTANASRITINSSGNVGIGTTSPGARLAIQGTGSYGSVNWGTASDMAIRSSEMTDSAYHSILQLVSIRQSLTTGNAANGYLGFSTIDDSNAQGMLDAGRIAIVNESVSSRNSATALSFWTNPGGVVDTVPATEKVRITSAGNVGIGTTNPQTALHISGATPFIMVNGTSTSGEPGLSILNA